MTRIPSTFGLTVSAISIGIGMVTVFTSTSPPPWFILIIVVAVFFMGRIFTISAEESSVIQLLAGIPLVLTLAATFLWAGVIAQCGIFGLVLFGEETAPAYNPYLLFLPLVLLIFLVGMIINASNHMLLPVLIIAGGSLGFTGLMGVMNYRLKRAYR